MSPEPPLNFNSARDNPGTFLTAAIAVFAGSRIARLAALVAVLVVFGWLTAQVAIIGYVSWMQPTTAVAGL
jgi:hypothetical protein